VRAHTVTGAPRICVSLAPSSRQELATWSASSASVAGTDMVELRLDTIQPPLRPAEVGPLLALFDLPLIATCRMTAEGGAWSAGEGERVALLRACLAAGATYVDVESDAAACEELLAANADRLVVSKHWPGPPSSAQLQHCVARLLERRPGAAKLVVAIERVDEAIPVLQAAEALRSAGVATTAFVMGEASAAGRLLAAARGDAWIYARAPLGAATAAGQWSAARLRDQLVVPRWDASFARFAVIGDPVRQSLSPVIFNAAFAAAGREALYVPLPGDRFDEVLRLAEHSEVRGLSVTMPFKREAMDAAVTLTDAARSIGAANTLRFEDGAWQAHNTDGEGLLAALAPHVDVAGRRVAVLGAGGAARAAAVSLRDAGAQVTLYARDAGRASSVAKDIQCRGRRLSDYGPGGAEVVINATPVGMAATDETLIPTADLQGEELVLDMIYRPTMTRFLRGARERGCTAVSGLEMFLEQAAAQHRWWFEEAPIKGVMRRAAAVQLEAERERA